MLMDVPGLRVRMPTKEKDESGKKANVSDILNRVTKALICLQCLPLQNYSQLLLHIMEESFNPQFNFYRFLLETLCVYEMMSQFDFYVPLVTS